MLTQFILKYESKYPSQLHFTHYFITEKSLNIKCLCESSRRFTSSEFFLLYTRREYSSKKAKNYKVSLV